jgi:Bifunctional DNA primase/polymerase, N-terminal.
MVYPRTPVRHAESARFGEVGSSSVSPEGNLGQTALAYVAAGLAVFPVRPRSKRPMAGCPACRSTRCTGPQVCGHDLCHGHLDATRDPARIAAWWSRWPAANIGVSTGASGLAVVDLDGPAGVAQWRELTGVRATARTLTARTPSGGAHLVYAARGDRPLRCSTKELAADIDTRGVGGYIVAPPSVRRDGVYRWADDVVELDALPPIPAWVLDALAPTPPPPPTRRGPVHYGQARAGQTTVTGRQAAYVRRALAGEAQRVRDTPEGGRNDALYVASLKLGKRVGAGLVDADTVRGVLAEAAEAAGLDAREAERTITSGLTAGMSHPQGVPA